LSLHVALAENITSNITSDKIYERAVSLAPSITEIIYAINASDKLIGVTIFCNYPEDAKSKTKIGGYTTPSVEKIISLNPDLVFAHDLTDPDHISQLQNANITVVVINTSNNIDGIYYNIRTIAKYLGKEKEGENLIDNMKKRVEFIKKTKENLIFSSPKMAQIVWIDPLWISGRETFINDIMETAGGINVYSDVYRWQTVSIETLITRDPDIIIAPVGSTGHAVYNEIKYNTNFKNLKAVKNNDVYPIDEDIILRDGPRVIDAMECVMGMIISWEYNHVPKYCLNDTDCTSGKCDSSIHICLKLNSETCAFDRECINGNCENGTCKEKNSIVVQNSAVSSGTSKGRSSGGGAPVNSYIPSYTYVHTETTHIQNENYEFPSKNFNISELFGLEQTLNLGKDFKDVEITINVGNKTSKFKSDENGNVILKIPDYGEAEITISKPGFKNLTKTITVYAGSLNITKISGEKYGDEFKFKVTTKDGSPVKDATVEVYGQKLKTDEKGIAKTTIKTMEKIDASASAEDYKSAKVSFEVKPIGKLKIEVPEKVKQGETITIKVTDENKNPVANAKITINGIEQTADANGKIEYNVTTTSLTLKAEKEGYIPSEQTSVSVEAKPVTETKENYSSNYTKPSDNTLLIAAGILIVILLIAAYLIKKKQ